MDHCKRGIHTLKLKISACTNGCTYKLTDSRTHERTHAQAEYASQLLHNWEHKTQTLTRKIDNIAFNVKVQKWTISDTSVI